MAVDHKRERSCGIDICLFDLTDPSQLEALWQFIVHEAEHIAFVWIAPPCGAASRAREKPIPSFKAMGLPVPQPLRHINQPDQADGLGHMDKTKVELANQLYEAISTLIEICCKYQIPVAVENPHNSHYWNTSPMERVKRLFGTKFVNFHNCAHGGDRDKLTSLWVNNDILSSLTLFCDGQHRRASWKPKIVDNKPRFPTADEAAYPWLLCRRIVDAIKFHVLQQGAIEVCNISTDPHKSDHLGRVVLVSRCPVGSKQKHWWQNLDVTSLSFFLHRTKTCYKHF